MPEIYDLLNRVVGEIDGASAEDREDVREQKLRELASVLEIKPEQWAIAACSQDEE